jgi:hypothetical protein
LPIARHGHNPGKRAYEQVYSLRWRVTTAEQQISSLAGKPKSSVKPLQSIHTDRHVRVVIGQAEQVAIPAGDDHNRSSDRIPTDAAPTVEKIDDSLAARIVDDRPDS